MKNILLLVPKCNGPCEGKKWNETWPMELEKKVDESLWQIFTPGPLVISSLIDRDKYNVDVIDERFSEIDTHKSYDIVAMYTVTPNVNRAYSWCDYYRQEGTYIVLGGVHVTVCSDEASKYADTLLIGEAEKTWCEFLNDYEVNQAKKIYKQPVGEINIHESPIPDFKMLPQNARRIIPIQTARGCPNGCKFCNIRSIYGKEYRTKSVDSVILELEAALRVNPRATIYFTDDNFFCDKKRSIELVKRIEKYRILWFANTDVRFGMDEELVKEAYKSGCRSVLIGFESINPVSLNEIDPNNFKMNNRIKYESVIKTIQSNGIGVVGSFIIGLDDDDVSVFDNLSKFIKCTGLFGINITVNTPYPGTVSYENMIKEKRISTFNWNYYTIFQSVILPKKMSSDELNSGYERLLNEVHSHVSIMKRIADFKKQVSSNRV